MGKNLVLGVGNLIMCDDGFGIHVIRRLEDKANIPDDIEVVDGGTAGLDLLYYLEGVDKMIVIDAMEMMGREPGTLTVIDGDDIPTYLSIKMSPHDVALPDMLFAAKLRDLYPKEIIVYGVQPLTVDMGLELSPPVAAQIEVVVDKIIAEMGLTLKH
jgi:hydrogenase maturation protease